MVRGNLALSVLKVCGGCRVVTDETLGHHSLLRIVGVAINIFNNIKSRVRVKEGAR